MTRPRFAAESIPAETTTPAENSETMHCETMHCEPTDEVMGTVENAVGG